MSGDDPIAALEREDRLEDAARLAEKNELWPRATELWERACRYQHAARAALAGGDAGRALVNAGRASDVELEAAAIDLLAKDPAAPSIAERVRALGQPAAAARLRMTTGDHTGAAHDFEQAGLLLEAAAAFERAGDPKNAARCLERCLERDPEHHAARLALGRLLFLHRRLDAAVRALQRVPGGTPERREALTYLSGALASLGLEDAAREAKRELELLGGPLAAPPRPEAAPSVERVVFGRYRVVAEVATTPTARVLEAVDRITGDRVAVKIFAPTLRETGRDALTRFEREARVLGELRHPAIVPLRAYLPEGPAAVLAWMDGGSLADVLARGPVSPARAAEIAIAVLSALGEAHRRGILHRDIKPANVLFDGAGAAHLADFGTAHVADSAATVTAGIIGTLAYMAPEQRAGEPASTSSDVYGAGALFWHALTGGPPDAALPFLSDELEEQHRVVAHRLIAPATERPADSVTARDLIASLTWPVAVPRARATGAVPTLRPTERDLSLRLVPRREGVFSDTLLGREVHVVPADPDTLARVLPFARTDHPALASVLAHRADPPSLWIEAVAGEAIAGPLDASDARFLEQALEALHRAGGVHGAVDREHVVRRGGACVLRFPIGVPRGTPEADLEALRALSA